MLRSLLLTLALLLTALPALAQARPVGMITDVEGPVKVVSGGRTSRADLLLPLQAGDRLVLGAKARVAVTFFGDGHRETAGGPAELQVTAGGLGGGKVARTDASGALKGLTARAEPGGVRGAVTVRSERGEVSLAVPVRVLTSAKSGLRLPARGPTPAVVEVLDLEGRTVGQPLELLDSASPAPLPSKELRSGETYVALVKDDAGKPISAAVFTLTPADPGLSATMDELRRMAAADRTDLAPRIALAQIYDDLGAVELALTEVHQALGIRPSPALLRWAADLSLRLGDDAQARAYQRLAEALQPSEP